MANLKITFEDLFAGCSKCQGSGFDIAVLRAGAADQVATAPVAERCPICGGKGGELTESGLAIKRLLEKIDLAT